MARRPSDKQRKSIHLPSAAESREQLRDTLARRYVFGVVFLMAVLGYTAYQLTPGVSLGVPEEVRQPARVALGTLVVAATARIPISKGGAGRMAVDDNPLPLRPLAKGIFL